MSDSRFNGPKLSKIEDVSYQSINWYSCPGAKLDDSFLSFVKFHLSEHNSILQPDEYLNVRLSVGINNFTSYEYKLGSKFYQYNGLTHEDFIQSIINFKHSLSIDFPNAVFSFSSITTVDLLKYNFCQVDEVNFSSQCCPTHTFYKNRLTPAKENFLNFIKQLRDDRFFVDQQFKLNNLLHLVNLRLKNMNCNEQPFLVEGSSICALEKKIAILKSHSSRNPTYSRIAVKSNKLRDGLHGHMCCQLEWADMVIESFRNDDIRIKFIPRYLCLTIPFLPTNEFIISHTTNGLSKINLNFNYLTESKGYELFNNLMDLIEWETISSRSVKWFGPVVYSYGNKQHAPNNNWPTLLLELKTKIEIDYNVSLNSVLLNFYKDGEDHVRFHQDNESIFGSQPNIFSISLGCHRPFILGPKEERDSKKHKITINLTPGTLLSMSGATQCDWYHKIPPVANVGPRINATFRYCLQLSAEA